MSDDELKNYLLTNELALYSLHLAIFGYKYQEWKYKLFYSLKDDLKKYPSDVIMGFPCGDPISDIINIVKKFFPEWYEKIKNESLGNIIEIVTENIYHNGYLIKTGN